MYRVVVGLLRRMGVDRAIGFGVLTRAWALVAGPVTMLVIATGLSKVQQGFYYTFSSLLALQVFFELGLMFVIAQFASHEFAHLTWGDGGEVRGDPVHHHRLSELLGKSMKWFATVSVLMLVVLIPLGLWFLGRQELSAGDFAWRLPWILAVAGTAANLLAIPFLAVIMGSGDVASVNQRELMGAVVGSCASWSVISLHGGLYAAFAVNCGNALVSWSYLVKRKPELLRLAWRQIGGAASAADGIGWWSEVWPMQWKIALSWASGYFIYQLFNPVLFHYHGPVVAGQMGLTLSASNALMGAAIAWLNSKSPEFGRLAALREWSQLDVLFRRVFSQAVAFAAVGGVVGWGAIAILQACHPLGQRLIPAPHAALLLATVCVQIMIIGFATYLRAHKEEPFLVVSLIGGVLQGGTTWYLGKHYGTFGVAAGFLSVSLLFGLPSAWIIWNRCRRAWHR